jgi:hypothetical protein
MLIEASVPGEPPNVQCDQPVRSCQITAHSRSMAMSSSSSTTVPTHSWPMTKRWIMSCARAGWSMGTRCPAPFTVMCVKPP